MVRWPFNKGNCAVSSRWLSFGTSGSMVAHDRWTSGHRTGRMGWTNKVVNLCV